MQDKEGKSHCKSYKNQWDFQLDKLFSLFIMIFGFNKRYLEKNEYFCNRKKIIYAMAYGKSFVKIPK